MGFNYWYSWAITLPSELDNVGAYGRFRVWYPSGPQLLICILLVLTPNHTTLPSHALSATRSLTPHS